MAENSMFHNVNYQIVLGVGLICMMMVSAVVPSFPGIVEVFGLSSQTVGLLITVNTLPGFLFAPLGGVMADKLGKKRLLVFSLLSYGVLGAACALARDFNILLVLRFLQGVGNAPMAGVAFAIISDLFSGEKRAEAMGIFTTVLYVGYIIYPLVGGALAGLAWYYPFLLFLLSIPLGIVAIFKLNFTEVKNKQSLKDYIRYAVMYLKSWKVVWLFLTSVITYILLFGSYLVYFNLFIKERFQATPFELGIFIAVIGVFTALASLLLGKLSRKFPVVFIIIGAFVVYAVSMVLIPLMPSLWMCLIPTVVFAIAHGLNLPSAALLASRVTLPEHRTGFIALQNTMVLLGMTVAPLVIGLAFTLTNLDFTFVISAVIALLIPALAAIVGTKKLTF
jgi:MFS family permease